MKNTNDFKISLNIVFSQTLRHTLTHTETTQTLFYFRFFTFIFFETKECSFKKKFFNKKLMNVKYFILLLFFGANWKDFFVCAGFSFTFGAWFLRLAYVLNILANLGLSFDWKTSGIAKVS